MSVHAYAWVWQQSVSTPTHKFILAAMAEFADPTGLCWPSMSTLARMTGFHRATIARSIEELIEQGLLMRSTGKGKSNTYRLQLTAPKLPNEDRSSAAWDETIPVKNVIAFPGVSHSATPQISTGVAEDDTQVSHSATPLGPRVSQRATGGVASDATGGVASDATRTVMNRYEPSARAHESSDPDAWHRIPDESRALASRRIAELRAQIGKLTTDVDGVGLVDTTTGEVLCAAHGLEDERRAHEDRHASIERLGAI